MIKIGQKSRTLVIVEYTLHSVDQAVVGGNVARSCLSGPAMMIFMSNSVLVEE